MLSIIIITKDNKKDLYKTLKSINEEIVKNNFTSKSLEIIIVDKSIKYKVKDLIEEFPNLIDFVSIFYQEKEGIFNAFNIGILKSNNDWLCFINSGDILLENSLFKAFKIVKNNRMHKYNSYIFQSDIYFEDLFLGTKPLSLSNSKKLHKFCILFPSVFWPCHQAIIFSREWHLKNLYPEYLIGGDEKIIYKIIDEGNFLFSSLRFSVSFANGVSSSVNLSFEKYFLQIKDSLLQGQYRRCFSIFQKIIFKLLKINDKFACFMRKIRFSFYIAVFKFLKIII
tara:strand:+ start:19535 stop:20380 length:846 start_codon:yes stop_codon:yes gene_type:complete